MERRLNIRPVHIHLHFPVDARVVAPSWCRWAAPKGGLSGQDGTNGAAGAQVLAQTLRCILTRQANVGLHTKVASAKAMCSDSSSQSNANSFIYDI